MTTVYLAGPITGLDYAGATDWREYAIAELAKGGIKGLSPMRAKNFLANVTAFEANCDGYGSLNALATNRGIMTRDRFDATRCDVLLVNFLGAKRVSVGTAMEIAWADLARIPIVCAMEPEGNPHDHGMINEALGYRVTSLDEAIAITRAILEV